MSGLSGFGFSAIGAVTLMVLPPSLGVPLLMTLSTANQMLSIHQLKVEMTAIQTWESHWPMGPGPFVLGGLIGAPLGVWLLHVLPTPILMALFGTFLVTYVMYSVLKPNSFTVNERRGAGAPIAVGFTGGVLGGFTAFPGAAVVIWMGLTKRSKEASRAIIQSYILSLQIYCLAVMAILQPQTFGPDFWYLLFVLLPAVLPFTVAGVRTYRSISNAQAKRLTFYLLGGSGVSLMVRGCLSHGIAN